MPQIKGLLRNLVVLLAPIQVLVDSVFEVLLGALNGLSLKCNGVIHIGNSSEKERRLLIESKRADIAFI
jgi:hypothetical protein